MAKPGNKTPQQKIEATRKILAALRSGSTVEAACSFARTSKQTWYTWLKKDPDLRADYEEALAHSEISLVKVIKEDKSWQSKAWLLERRFRDRWSQTLRAEIVTAPQENPFAKLTREQARQALDYLDALERGESPTHPTPSAPKRDRSKKPPR